MGREAANLHVGRKKQIKQILQDLNRRKPTGFAALARKWRKQLKKIGVSIPEDLVALTPSPTAIAVWSPEI
jgi:hypothetical protein